MTGLLIKDFVTSKRQHLIFLGIVVFMLILGILQKDFKMFFAVLSAICLLAPYSAIAYDEVSKFDKFAITMPVKKQNIVKEKYLYCFLFVLFYLVLALVLASVKSNFVNDIKIYLTIVSFSVIVFSISCPLIYKFGIRAGQILIFTFIFFTSAIIGLFFEKIDITSKTFYILEIVFPSISVIAFISSYFVTKLVYNNKKIN